MADEFTVIENTPGYLPEEDEPFIGTYSQAVSYMNERASEYEDDGWRVERGWASEGNYAAVMAWDDTKSHDLGRFIGVVAVEE